MNNINQNNLTISYDGGIGDILCSLWYIKQLSQKLNQKINFHIQTNVKVINPTQIDNSHENNGVHCPTKLALFIKPFLQKCEFLNSVTVGNEIPEGALNCDVMKVNPLNTMGGDMRDYIYNYFLNDIILPREFWKKIIDVEPNYKYKDKIIFTLTERYLNVLIDYRILEYFKDRLVFLGTDKEYNIFNQKYFKIDEKISPTTLLEVAQYIKGCRGFISNQTGFFIVAELMKTPRILLPPDFMMYGNKVGFGPKNTLPQGGWCQNVSFTNRLIPCIEQMWRFTQN